MKSSSLSLSQTYQLQLQEIGNVLKASREADHIAIEAIAEKTLIRASLLRAIESGDLAQLPEPVYVRGLIRRYGNALGLDGDALAIQFFTPVQAQRRSGWTRSGSAQLRPLHLYLTYVLVMVAAISSLAYLLRRTAPEMSTMPALDPLAQREETQSDRQQSVTNSEDGTEAPAQAPSDSPIEVEMTLTAQSWLRIVADGETTFEGILQQGDSRSWTADQQLTIRAGNAGGVVVSYNNGQSQRLGEPGMVAEVTYAPTQAISVAF
ncbi:DUF4115 domain-containing protein [filamentous cyanobacterium CCP5]|nr:DUF4115 domain-containing protein [filamentous cyanobacterium CCP5]